jgi:hypothetical protein
LQQPLFSAVIPDPKSGCLARVPQFTYPHVTKEFVVCQMCIAAVALSMLNPFLHPEIRNTD